MIASAFLALVACNKEPIETPVQKEGPSVLTFRSEKPQFDPSTKTEWNGSTIIWSSGDQMRVGYTFNGNWMGQSTAGAPKFYVSNQVAIDGSNFNIGTFSVPAGEGSGQFIDPGEGSYVFYSFFPKSAGEASAVSSDGIATLTLPDSQTPLASSFDKSADIMIGKTATLSLEGLPEDPIEIAWSRIVAHADLTFSNLAFDGSEKVSEITLTSSGKIAGPFTVNLANGTITTGDDAVNTIIIKGDNLTVNGNSVEAWCGVLPGEFTSIGVVVKTDKATYTKSITGISDKAFKKNARNTLIINMTGADRIVLPPVAYSLYSDDLTDGDYIIYDAVDKHALKAEIASSRFAYSAVTPSDDIISTNDNSIVWHIAKSGNYYTIYNASVGKYAAAGGSNNQGQLLDNGSDDRSLWSVSGKFDFINKSNSRYLRSNGTNGFATYASSTGHVLALYKYDSRVPLNAPASVSAEINANNNTVVDVTFSSVADAGSYVIVATPTSGDPVEKTGISASPASISVVDGLSYSTAYTISVYAVPAANDTDHRRSPAKEADGTVTTGAPEGYVLLSSTEDVPSGLYVIAAKVGDNYYAMSNDFKTTISGTNITPTGGLISESDASGFVVNIIKDANNKYSISNGSVTLGITGSDFVTNATGNNALWSISTGKHGTFRIAGVGVTSRGIVYRTGNVNAFKAYALNNASATSTEYYDVELFKFNGTALLDPVITVTPSSPVSLEKNKTQQLTVTSTSSGTVTYESSDEDIVTVNNTGLITAIDEGSATITINVAAKDNYKSASVSVTVIVTAGPSSIADVISAAVNEPVYTAGVVAQVNTKGFIITDGNDNINVYQNATPSVVNGQAVVVNGKRGEYSNVSQVINPTITAGETGQTVTRTELTTITGTNATGYTTNQYVSLTGVLTISGTYYNISINGSSTQGSLYSVSSDATFNGVSLASMANKTVTVTGYVTGSTNNFLNIAPVDIVVDANAPDLSVTPLTYSWPADNDDAIVFTVTPTNGTWDYSTTILDWATISKTGNVLTVTPKAKQAAENYSGTITITLTPSKEGYSAKTATIELSQAKYSDSGYESTGNLATFAFTSTSYPSNKTNFAATSGTCPASTFYLNGTGSQWNTTKGYAFTAVTDVTVTILPTKPLKQGSTIVLSMATFYNKASNAPMTGFTIKASESGNNAGTNAGTNGLSVTSWSLSTTSATKSVTYTLQNDVAVGQSVVFILTGTGKAGSGQGYINDVIANYSDN